MPVRNGLLSTLRAKGRTALFTLLILVLTVALALGLGMWAYCGGLLAQMEEQYTSVALVEYMGENYPDEDTADSGARAALDALDDEALSAVDGVELWERTQSTFVSIDGYRRPSGNSPYRDSAVVVAAITPEYGIGRGRVDEADLPPARAVKHFELDGEVKLSPQGYSYQDQYTYYTFYFPGLEPLTLPYYYLHHDTGLYQRYWVEDSLSEEPPEGAYVLRHAIPDQWGNQWWIDSIVGELPEGYDQYSRDFADNYYPYFREFIERRLMGAPEWPVYEYYEDYDGETNVYYSNHETVLDGSFGRVSSALYSSYGTGSMSCYFDMGTTDFLPEKGKLYLLHGAFVSGGGARTFQVQPFPDGGGDPWLELSGEDDPALTESVFVDYAELYRLSNNTAFLTASDNIPALELFQQGTLYLADGRFPQAGEAGVCVISGSMAENLGMGVGDTLELQILESNTWNRSDVSATGDRRSLTIVGVTNPQTDYAARLWVSAAEGDFSSPPFGYLLGMAVLGNRKAAQAAEELSAQLPLLVQLTLYDQGYAAAARPIQAMETAAQAITLAAAFGTLAVLVLFAFLFVGRQRETVGVLVSLGTPAGKIRLWLLSGAAAISGAAALLGAVVGALTLGRVTAAAMAMAERLYATDTRYSEAANGLIKESMTVDTVPGWPAPVAGAAVFLAALALCLAFLRHARKENAPKRGKVSVRVPKGRTSVSGRGALRFAVLSARRGGRRSVVVVSAALVLTLFVSLLAASTQSWSRQMDELYDSSRLQGQV
ncbi:MAG: ABC transporter permease, partial [Oscillospiraceae bacterium]|nr:ABC transporter permease [Oscillospiraceae bacterium]